MVENLETDYGMLAFSADAGSQVNISPFVSGFHLEVGSDDGLSVHDRANIFSKGTPHVGYA